jgi:hypothetical protein
VKGEGRRVKEESGGREYFFVGQKRKGAYDESE